jgi:hypothetical protein
MVDYCQYNFQMKRLEAMNIETAETTMGEFLDVSFHLNILLVISNLQ